MTLLASSGTWSFCGLEGPGLLDAQDLVVAERVERPPASLDTYRQ